MTHQTDTRHFLKHATAAAHQEAEAAWSLNKAFADLKSYKNWLDAMLEVHEQLGMAAAASLGDSNALIIEQARVDAIRTDLGVTTATRRQSPLRSKCWAWGVLYALNGSAMGASILIKSSALHSNWPVTYLTLMRNFAASGDLFKFLETLNTAKLDRTSAAEGANDTFRMLGQYSKLDA